MGRFVVSRKDTVPFLLYVLTNNVLDLAPAMAQYRKRFTEMKYCLPLEEAAPFIEKLWKSLR